MCCPDSNIAKLPGYENYCSGHKLNVKKPVIVSDFLRPNESIHIEFENVCFKDGKTQKMCQNQNNKCVAVTNGLIAEFEGETVCAMDAEKSCSVHATECARSHQGIRIDRKGGSYGLGDTLKGGGFNLKSVGEAI